MSTKQSRIDLIMEAGLPMRMILLVHLFCATVSSSEGDNATTYCKNIDSLTFRYSFERSKLKFIRYKYLDADVQLRFSKGEIASWPTERGDLVKNGMITPNGCLGVFPGGTLCSIGYWDESSTCYLPGFPVLYKISNVIVNFGAGGDYALLYYEYDSEMPTRQVVVYRKAVGAIYSRYISPTEGIFTTREEVKLDSVSINSKSHSPIRQSEFDLIVRRVDTLERWFKSPQYDRVRKNSKRIDWHSVFKMH